MSGTRRGGRSNAAILLLLVMGGLGLAGMGAVRFRAALADLEGAPGMAALAHDQNQDSAVLRQTLQDREAAVGLDWRHQAEKDRGMVEAILGRRFGLEDPRRRALLDRAAASLETGLAQAPTDSFAWLWLARLRLQTEGPSPEAAEALMLSLEAAPVEPALVGARLDLAATLRPVWPAGMSPLVERQIQLLWHDHPDAVAQWAQTPN